MNSIDEHVQKQIDEAVTKAIHRERDRVAVAVERIEVPYNYFDGKLDPERLLWRIAEALRGE